MPEERHENDAHEEASYDKALERRVVRKCDIYMLPILTMVYLLGVLDRNNVGNAAIAGFDYKYLHTTPELYNFAVAIYFISYMIFEIPSNLVTKILGFHIWLPIIMVCWAVISMSQAVCTNVPHLIIIRFLLGMAEAGFPPSVIGYVGLFYARNELTLRLAIFMALVTIAGALSGIAAFFIVQISGTSFLGFQWLFIIEGIPTILTAIVVALFLTRGPGDARFLTSEERKFVIDRLRPEGGPTEIDRNTAKAQIKLAFTDVQVYIYLIMLLCASITFNALNFFLPTLIKQLGYTSVQAQLMVVPTLLIATVCVIFNCWASDKYQTRAWNLMVAHITSIIGLIGMIATDAKNPSLYPLRYFFTVILACGSYSVIPISYSWFSCNTVGQYKRSVSIAIILSLANFGAVIGVQIYPATDAPAFINGNIICLSAVLAQVILVIGMKLYLDSLNKKRDLVILVKHNYKYDFELKNNKKKLREIAMKLVENEPKFDEVLCDKHPNWRYIT
ncbi:major facilitator superfamily domain-containing protein [Gigaspora rosea]|uniref:Major facilitator superfamily domain-containing protein n=1 Tax=Gigaspora rosea TaxID=44941 RepID=A0A397UE49_9GLOM|nr:major facilitator superfamily domain-containing protein [Gigaspora rosea]